jgi:hypothetical protein
MTSKTVRKTAATKSAKLIDVTLRRLGKPVGSIPAGRYILVLNPKLFGSTGDNWLGGSKATFESREAAIESAPKLGGRIAS